MSWAWCLHFSFHLLLQRVPFCPVELTECDEYLNSSTSTLKLHLFIYYSFKHLNLNFTFKLHLVQQLSYLWLESERRTSWHIFVGIFYCYFDRSLCHPRPKDYQSYEFVPLGTIFSPVLCYSTNHTTRCQNLIFLLFWILL